jgi:hypothetical protein
LLKRCVRYSSFPAQSQSDFLACPWTKCAADPKYDDFKDALEQALEKVDVYYHKTSNSNAYMFAKGNFARFPRRALPNHSAVLNPVKKLSYFKNHWLADLQEDPLTDIETVNVGCLIVAPRTNTLQFKARYLKIHCAPSGTSVTAKKSKTVKMRRSVVLENEEDNSGTYD